METNKATPGERRSLALSSMIIGIVAFICVFIPGWRIFGLVIAVVGLILSAIGMRSAAREHTRNYRSVTGLIFSIAALGVAAYFIFSNAAVTEQKDAVTEMPAELTDSVPVAEEENALDKLKNITDSVKAQ